ncbi:MAG: glycosyltransferase, partial [Dehalococcoidia bacterium]
IHDPEILPLGLLLKWLTRRPVIYDAHEYYGDEVQTRQWIPASLRIPAGWLTERIEKAVAKRLAAVVTVNEHMNALFLRVQPRSVAVHNYPPAEFFTAPPAGPREQLVVYAGTLTVDRGLETIYQAGRLLRARYPDLEIIVAGPVDWAGIDPAVPRDRHRWGQDAGVHFLGTLPPRQVPALLQRASVGWIPFQATPNNIRATPIKLLEYMAAELPVVASDLDGMRAIITVAGSGLLARAADASSHAEAIAWLLEHPSEVLSMGERGRRSVLERYTWASEGEKLVGLYEEVGGRK